jgi:hypothetical protein
MWHNAASEISTTVRGTRILRISYFAWARAKRLLVDSLENRRSCAGMPIAGNPDGLLRIEFTVYAGNAQ